MRGYITVPLKADESYKRALRALAALNGMTVGEFVRHCIDQSYVDHILDMQYFFSDDGPQKGQSAHE